MSHAIRFDAERNVLPTSHGVPGKEEIQKTIIGLRRFSKSAHQTSTSSSPPDFPEDPGLSVLVALPDQPLRLHRSRSKKTRDFICSGTSLDGRSWGCGNRYPGADCLARHHKKFPDHLHRQYPGFEESIRELRRQKALSDESLSLGAESDVQPGITRAQARSVLIYRSPGNVSGQHAKESQENSGRNSTATTSPSISSEDTIIDGETSETSRLVAYDLSVNADDLLLPSRTSACIFKGAQTRLERMLLDLRSFDDDDEDNLSVASEHDFDFCSRTLEFSSETSELDDACDEDQSDSCSGEGKQARTREASDGTSPGTGASQQDHDRSGRKRQRIDNDGDGHSRAIVKTKQQNKPASSGKRRLICSFRGDTENPCPGTDQNIGEVIYRLAKSHKVYICKTCYVVLIESDSGEKLHPPGDICIKQCLSPQCHHQGKPTAGDQKHPFRTESCGTETGRARPDDRGSIYRFIFKLVHPDKEVPAEVFTTETTLHWDMIPRQGNHKATRGEVEPQLQILGEELEELRERDSTHTTQIDILTRDLEAERTITAHLRKKMQRLQIIIAEALQPETAGNEKWLCSLRRRAEMETSDALDFVLAPAQAFPTPPVSLHTGQRSSAFSTPNDTGTTRQDQPSRNVRQQHHNNYAASEACYPSDEQALPNTQSNSFAFPDNLGNAYDTTTNFELSTNSSVGTMHAMLRSNADEGDLLQSKASQPNPHQPSPHQFDPHIFNQNHLDPNRLYPSIPNQHSAFQSNPFCTNSNQLYPNHLDTNQWAGETQDSSSGSAMFGPQDPFLSTSFGDRPPESLSEDVGSSMFQGTGYGSMQWQYPPPGQL